MRRVDGHVELTLNRKEGAMEFVVSLGVWVQSGNDWRILDTQQSDLVPKVVRWRPEPRSLNPLPETEPEEAPANLEKQGAKGREAETRK